LPIRQGSLERVRRFYDLLPEENRAGIGHNGGPPLDVSYKAWMWRKAHAKAWQSPGREVVMLRLRRAERLGLSYEAYTSVILDRGARLEGVIVMLSPARRNAAAAKLAKLGDCCKMLCVEEGVGLPDGLRVLAANIAFVSRDGTLPAIRRLVAASCLPPSAVFLVGPEPHRRTAEQAGLGLFVDERIYLNR
jgi:hypothetical protein